MLNIIESICCHGYDLVATSEGPTPIHQNKIQKQPLSKVP